MSYYSADLSEIVYLEFTLILELLNLLFYLMWKYRIDSDSLKVP